MNSKLSQAAMTLAVITLVTVRARANSLLPLALDRSVQQPPSLSCGAVNRGGGAPGDRLAA